MSKRKDRIRASKLYTDLLEMSARSKPDHPTIAMGLETRHETRKMGKFRFHLLHQWIIENFEPCRVADIGGGKGMLTWLLRKSGWDAMVIDPISQSLPRRSKDIATGKRIRIPQAESVPRIHREFEIEMASHFDLLVGMHAHGCNIKIIAATQEFNCSFVLIPCCIIDEPLYPPRGIHWLQSLIDYAMERGLDVRPFQLNFSGQNIGLYAHGGKPLHRPQGQV